MIYSFYEIFDADNKNGLKKSFFSFVSFFYSCVRQINPDIF